MELLALSSRLLLVAVLTLYGLISVVPPGGVTQPWRQVLRGGEARFRSIVDGLRSTVDVIRPPFQSPVPWTPRIEFESLKAEAVNYFTEEPEEEPILRLYSQLDSWPAYSPKNLPPLRLIWREEMPAELPLWAVYTLIAPTVLSIILVLAWWIRSTVNPQASDNKVPPVSMAAPSSDSQPALSDGAASTASALDEADSGADVQGAPPRVSRSRNRVVSSAVTTTLLVQVAPLAYVVDAPNPLDSVLAYLSDIALIETDQVNASVLSTVFNAMPHRLVQGATRVGAIRVCKLIDRALRRRQRKLQARYGPKYGQQLDWIQEVPEPECRDNERDGNDSDGLGNAGFLNGVVRWLLATLAAFLSVSGLDSDASSTVSSSTWAQEVFSPQSIMFTTVDVPVGVSVTGDTPGMGDTEVLGTRSDGASPRSALQGSREDVQHIGASTTELVHPPLTLSSPASASVSVATIQGQGQRAQPPSSSDCPRVGLDGASPRSSLQDPREDVQHIGASSTTEPVHPPLTLSSSPATTPVSVATVQGETHQVQHPSLSDFSRVGVPSTSAPEPSEGVPQVSTRRTVPSSHTAREGTSRSGIQVGEYLHPTNGSRTRLSGTSYQTPSGKLFLAYAQGRIDRSAKGTTRT